MSGNNQDNNEKDNKDNVVAFKRPKANGDAPDKKPDEQGLVASSTPPLINLPPVTQYLLITIIAIHMALTWIVPDTLAYNIYYTLGFIPARFSGDIPFTTLSLLTPFTYMLLHASWLHIAMNGIMFMAFGAGVERWLGAQKMVFILIISSLIGIGVQYALDPHSIHPVIGASAGLSGLFAAAFIMINRFQGNTNPYGIWPFIILWIVISVVFGLIGSPDGNAIAWAAHIGGFMGGFAALKLLKVI